MAVNFENRVFIIELLYFQNLLATKSCIFVTFGAGNEYFGRPRNPNFLMKPGELLNLLTPHLHIVAYEHGEETTPRPSVRQRICAVKGDGPYVLP